MNARQLRFCQEYLKTGDVTNSAITAGYSPKTAYAIGSENLQKPEIALYIEDFRKQMEKQTGVTVERVVLELTKVAFADIGDVLEVEDGEIQIKSLSELSKDVRSTIAEISITPSRYGTKRSVKLHSKLSALDMLMKHLGGYVTLNDIIDRLTPEQVEEITAKLLTKLNDEKTQ